METNSPSNSFNWHQAIDETYQDLSRQFVEHAPEIIGALALLVFGWLMAHLLRLGTRKTIQGLDSLFDRFSRGEGANKAIIKRSYSIILSNLVFWAVILFFITASANLLGWELFAGWMDEVISFLPSLITGILIILAGFLLSNAVRAAILSGGIQQARLLSRIAQAVILFSSVVIGIELIGLNMHFLTTVVVVVIGILLAGAALAFGLGARTMVGNIIGIQHARKQLRVGDQIELGNVQGSILEITQTNIVLESEQGRNVVPGRFFHEQVSHLSAAQKSTESAVEKD